MAIGKLFEVQGSKIIPKEDCYIIQPIKKMIDEYPDEYPKLIAYLHYMNSLKPDDNPYADVPFEVRSEQIIYDLKITADVQDDTIVQAMTCVEEKYFTTFYGLYKGIKSMLDKIASQFFTTDINFDNKEGNSANIVRVIKDYENLRKSFKLAYRDFEEENGGGRARGGASLADDEEEDY